MSDRTLISTYSKGRLSTNLQIRELSNIKEGDIFLVDVENNKLIFTKIDKDKLKSLKK